MAKEKQNILFLHANNNDIGGADLCMYKLVLQIDKAKFRPVVGLSKRTEIFDFYKKAGIKTYIIDMERIQRSKNPINLVRLFFKLFVTIKSICQIVKREEIDLIQGNDLLDIYGSIAGKLAGIKTTQYIRWILRSTDTFKTLITRLVYAMNDRVITVSDSVALHMFTQNEKRLPKTVTCYDWIDLAAVGHDTITQNLREEYGVPPRSPLVGVVGRLDPWKGQEIFVRAAEIVSRYWPDAYFIIIGGRVQGRDREKYALHLESLADQLRIRHRIIFTGHRKDISIIMKSLNILVHTSIQPDPLPGVIMEAMYCAKPVVGANAGGVPEEIIDGETGILYPPGDYKRLATSIKFLLENPKIAKTMGEAGKKRVSRVFNKDFLCKKMENIYESILNLV